MSEVPAGHLFLGETIDPTTGDRAGEQIHLEASDLTTHGVIVGMTGSGKTGLSVIMLEEALLQGVPTIIIDPKGDMGNLLLTFPHLDGASFEPWVNSADADRAGISIAQHAVDTADMWREGLASWSITPDRIQSLRDQAEFTIYTPGSTSGVPLNIIGNLKAPVNASNEMLADEVEGFVSSILGLVDIDADPLSSREHILLSNLVHRSWAEGQDLDLGILLGQIQNPPMRKLGVLDVEAFYPAKDRMALVMKLNGLLASPSFASWTEGEELNIDNMLGQGPKASIVSIAHLSDSERQFVVTLLLSKIVTWMRTQPGTPELRALIYMDEVFGYVPPTAAPPSKKPILTILKQARAFGVGLVLATQNPVDIDYKALSNAGTWMVGRLQTERDTDRLLDGMTAAGGDKKTLRKMISGLGKRQFVLHQTRSKGPQLFGTRWAMSYLPGPLTRQQIATLTPDRSTSTSTSAGVQPSRPAAALRDDETTSAPDIADGTVVGYVTPSAPWLDAVGGHPDGKRLQAGVAARVNLLFDETKGNLRHEVEWEAIITPIEGEIDPDNAIRVDFDDRDFLRSPVADDYVYALPDAKIHTKGLFSTAKTQLRGTLYREETLELWQNIELKMMSRPGESENDFKLRCGAAADELADADVAKLRASLERKVDRVNLAIQKSEDRIRELESDADSRQREQMFDLAGSVLGSVLGGRRSTRGMVGMGRRASSRQRTKSNAQERLRTAENRLEEKIDELEELETELTDTLFEIQADWDERADEIERIDVPLEKTDISIDDFKLVWIPTK